MFRGGTLELVVGCFFTLLLLSACVTDVRTRRIPNELVVVLGVAGLLFSVASGSGWEGVLRGLGGVFVGLLIWLPFYILKWLGAGDVKLFAAAAAWLGPSGAVEAALLSAFAGGLLSLLWLVRRRRAVRTVKGLGFWAFGVAQSRMVAPPPLPLGGPEHALPYGVALSIGIAVAAWHPGLLF